MVVPRAGESVLIVEDDDNISFLQCRSLRKAGYDVEAADSEAAAFERLAGGHFDLLILDYRLSGVRTGLDVFTDLRVAGHNQPVIMVTGYGDETIVIQALRAGVRDFVIKSNEYLEYLPLAVERVLAQIQLEHRLVEADRQLRHAQKMEAVGQLAGGVAHEFNNLLQTIQGYTRFVMESLPANDSRRDDLEQVLTASDRAAVLTRQLLDFSRREVLQMTPVEPNALVHNLMKMLRPLIGEHITIQLDLAENIGRVHADPAHIEQMLMNLCVNARDAMPRGGRLTIKTADAILSPNDCELHPNMKPGRYVLLSVADNGCGMPPEVKNHIFEPFFTTKEIGKGTGLGLAIVYGAVQQHHGNIHVDSEPGIGTTFKIYLPALGHDAAKAPNSPRIAPSDCEEARFLKISTNCPGVDADGIYCSRLLS